MNGLKQLTAKKTETMASVVNHIRASVPPCSNAAEIEEKGCQVNVTLNKEDYIIVNLNNNELNRLYGTSKSKGGEESGFSFRK